MDQAMSYADAPNIQAEFALVTNGKDWQVKRRIQGKWCAVPHLPREIDRQKSEPITDLLRGLDVLAPLLFKLDQPLAGEDAQRFLAAMQCFFHGTKLLTFEIDRDLLIATDNLLRVSSLADEHANYRSDKLASAVKHFELYRSRKGFAINIFSSHESIPDELQSIHASLMNIVETAQGLSGGEVFLLRLDVALAEYGMMQRRRDELYPKRTQSLHGTLRDYLNYALVFHLNVSLPDHLDNILLGDMRGYCRSAWEQVEVDNRVTLGEFLSIWASVLFSKTQFWKKRP